MLKKLLDIINIRFSDVSKRYQLIIAISLLLFMISVGFSFMIPNIIEENLFDDFKATHNLVVNIIANNLSFPLSMTEQVFVDDSDFETNTSYIYSSSKFTHLFIYNNYGTNIYRKIDTNNSLIVQLFRPKINESNYIEKKLELYIVEKDIVDMGGLKLGKLVCIFSIKELNETVDNIRYRIIFVCFVIFLIGIFIIIFISNLIAKPLEILLSTFGKIAAGDFTVRANIITNEEFGQLSRTFNKMVDNLEDSYFELSEANKNMELKVEQRTLQLRNQIEVRSQAEEKLKSTNKMVYSIINTSPLPIITLTIDFKVKTASPAFSQIFKFEEYEVIDRVLPFVILSDVDTLKQKLKSLNEPNQIDRIITMGRRKDGMLVDLNITAVSEFDDNNEKFGYILVIDDITERLLSEKALQQSEIKYRSLIEDSIVGIGLIKDNNFVFANNALLNIWKCDNIQEFLAVPFMKLVSIADRDNVINLLNTSSNNGEELHSENVELEIKIICFDGTEKYVQLVSNALYLEPELLLQITFVDITDRKNAETEMIRLNEELEERVVDRTSKLNKTLVDLRNEMSQKAKLSKDLQFKSEILEHTTSFCIVFNQDAKVVYVSPFSLSLLGYKSEDITGIYFWEKVYAKILEGDELNSNTILNWLSDKVSLSSGYSYILETRTQDNTTKYLRLSNSVGQNNTLIMAGAEVTDQVQTQRALEEMSKRLEKTLETEKELNELKTRFISMVSHEFRTPLTVILNSTGVIEQAFESDRADIGMQYLDKISKSVKTMNRLMEDVLLIGKGQTNKVKSVDELDFVEFVISSLKDIQEAYSFTSKAILDVKIECKPFYSDETELKHIVHNLITNALKYTTNGKDVIITIDKEEDNLIFTVADQGIGIPKDDLNRLFSNFFRASNVGKIAGTGLGLHIVKQSVNNLLGDINVYSVVNEGTTFVVKLPMDIREKLAEIYS